MRERSIFDGDIPGIHNPLLGTDPRLSTPTTIPTTTPARPVTKLPTTATPAPTEDDYGDITEQPGNTPERLSREELAAQEAAAWAEHQAAQEAIALSEGYTDAILALTEEEFGADEPNYIVADDFPEDDDFI